MGIVFAFWLFFPCIFINYCNYRVNHREFLWLVVASQCQMSSDINILYHSYQQLVNITRNGLNTKRSLHFSAYFTFLSILVNFPLTGNDICHSKPKPWYFIISNASHSINLLLAQWRHTSSESAVALLLRMCLVSIKYDAKSKAWDILLVLTSVAGNLCNKCLSGYSNKTAVKVILSMRFLVSIKQQSPRRPCDKNLVGKSCGKILRENLVGKFLQEILAGKSCRKILQENLVGNSCRKFLQEILVGNVKTIGFRNAFFMGTHGWGWYTVYKPSTSQHV